MKFSTLPVYSVGAIVLAVVFLHVPSAHAATYTYTRTFTEIEKGKYSLEGSAVVNTNGTSCYTYPESLYATQNECTAELSKYSNASFVKTQFPNPPYTSFTVLSRCQLINKPSAQYTSPQPVCQGMIAKGFVLKSGPRSGGLSGGDTSGGLSGGDSSGDSSSGDGSGQLVNPLNNIKSLPDLLTAILKGVVEIGAIFLTVMIVYVGFLFVAAQGNAEKLSSARSALVWTIIGGLLLLGAEAISLVIQATVKTL